MRAIPTLKISISGVRGVIGASLTPSLLTRFAEAFGTYNGGGTIILGRDTRTSGEMVRQAVIAGLLSSGCRVIDLDICPVPTVQLLVRQHKARGGICITASHNPAEWNALKFINAEGLFLSSSQARELLDIYHQGDFNKIRGAEMRTVELLEGAIDRHIEAILASTGKLPANRKLKVALDSCNGAASILAPKLIEALGAEVVTINTTPDGKFPRGAEPVAENISSLCRLVRESGADVGFAQDMDADRLAVVDETGTPIGEDNTLVLAADYILSRQSGPLVANLSTTCALDEVARRRGVSIYRSKIGEANVTEMMQKVGAVIGGEGNGGVIYPAINFCRDSQVGIALILHSLADSGLKVSEILRQFSRLHMLKEKLDCPSGKIARVLRLIRTTFADREIDLTDGVKVKLDNGWLHVRGSNTEPIIRLVAEAETVEEAGKIVRTVYDNVASVINQVGD